MSDPVSQAAVKPAATPGGAGMRRKVLVDFGLFTVFFLYYMGAAVVQTPLGKDIATIQILGAPFGLLMSLGIFPVSWILIAIWFWKAR